MERGTFFVFIGLFVVSTSAQSLLPSPLVSGQFMGCYRNTQNSLDFTFHSTKDGAGLSANDCVQECLSRFYRFAALGSGSTCDCGSVVSVVPAEQVDDANCTLPCPKNSSQTCGGYNVRSVYATGQNVPGPPINLRVTNISETGFHVVWEPAAVSNGPIKSYTVQVLLLKTYSHTQLSPVMSWTFTNNVLSTDILDLHPGSEYLVKVQVENDIGMGFPAQLYVDTYVGDPMVPNPPEVLARLPSKQQVTLKFDEGMSENGPITAYRIVVICGLAEVDEDLLDSYYNAEKKGLSYYITASLEPDAWRRSFTVGDGRVYGYYENVPLHFNDGNCIEEDIQFAVGVVSSAQNRSRISYSNLQSEKSVKTIIVAPEIKGEGFENGLIAAIVVCSVLLVLVIIAYFVARHFAPQRRGASRMEDPQEMCLQGPMIEVENYGYIPEEEEEQKVNHYDRLKKILWDIPRNFLDIHSNNALGSGEFGTFVKGTVLQNGYPTPTSVQCIEDGMLSAATKRSMLKELAILIDCGTGNHANVIRLIGTCESPEMLYVVLEYHPASLKDILLESRTLERPGYERDFSSVCSLPQQAFLQIGVGIAQGMSYLSDRKVIHKQLAACSVLMADGMVPKITNFGIAKCNRSNVVPDFTRWTAREVFRSQHFTVKSDVWSMGCLLWEAAALGGTLYCSIPTPEVAARVMRGLRPPHLSHVSDDLYQLMLQCWQLDLDERPSFSEIASTLCDLINSGEVHLDWSVVPGFQYEQYLQEHETSQHR